MPKVDTVGEKYFKPLERAETFGGWLFWIVTALSLAALFVDRTVYPKVYNVVEIAFIVCAIALFVLGQAQKLYFFPRAGDERRKELLSNSFNVILTHEETVGYYNNDQTNPFRRLAASNMESSFFTEAVARKMLTSERTRTVGYIVIYLAALLWRSTNLELLAVAAQVLFSEDIISRWGRLEWLRIRSERTFEGFNQLFTDRQSFSRPLAQSRTVDLVAFYETTKSTAAIVLSSKLFHAHNTRLSADWERIRTRLGI